MTKSEVEDFTRKHLDQNGLIRWSLELNGRLKRTLGRTSLQRGRVIELSKLWFVKYGEDVKDEVLKDVILHEIAHALDFSRRGTSDHSRKWKRCAREVGAEPTRTESRLPTHLKAKEADWKKSCPQCDFEDYFFQKPTSNRSLCPKCHEKYHSREKKKEYLLENKRNR